MAADLKEAVDNFLATATGFRALFELGEKLQEVGDVDRLASEAENRRDVAEAALADTAKQAAEATARAQADAEKIVSDANASASGILAQANAEANRVKAVAQAAADKITAKGQAAADEAMALAAANEASARDSEKRFSMAQGQLADLNIKIANARETIASLLKG